MSNGIGDIAMSMQAHQDSIQTQEFPVVIIGAGPAGLTSAYELNKQGIKTVVLEKASKVGGISRTETYKGYRFDIGGHRFFTKVGEVQAFWKEVLGNDFIRVPRLSRIYYENKYYDYPLSLIKTLKNLGLIRSTLILLSYLKAKFKKYFGHHTEPETFEQWVTDSFGERLYKIFFKTYTEKVWVSRAVKSVQIGRHSVFRACL